MRTWSITDQPFGEPTCVPMGAEELQSGESVEVIELEPLLDLLERAIAHTTVAVAGRQMIRHFIEEQRKP